MKTLSQYMPTMREAKGRLFFPLTSMLGTGAALVLLACAVSYAYRYPAVQAEEAAQRLEHFNGLTIKTTQGTQSALTRLTALVAEQPEWMREMIAKEAVKIMADMALIQPLSKELVLQQAQAQQNDYNAAQALIDASAFKGLDAKLIPLTADGKAYLAALKVRPPARFEYQRLADGSTSALDVLRAGLLLQERAEVLAHKIDVKINGDKAQPLGVTASPLLESARLHEVTELAVPAPVPAPVSALSALEQAERDAEQQQRQAALEVEQQQRKAEQEAQRAKQQAQRKQQQAQLAAERLKAAEERQARAAADAVQRAERDAQRKVEAEQARAAAAAEAKMRECTASLVARTLCAAQGYNPLTGRKL